ncbi:MAG TPA: leucine-rich repeat protein [Prolixibacteraceae bacterium]|jgi:hypothetical protein
MKPMLLLFIGICLPILLSAQLSKTVEVTAGNLKTVLTDSELSTLTNITLTGTMDARDFKTLRDEMPVLSVIDLSEVIVMAYSGTGGTSWRTGYPANEFPEYAFWNEVTHSKTSLVSVLIPSSMTVIGEAAFIGCTGLTSIILPPSVQAIKQGAFSDCSGLRSISIPSSVTYIGAGAFSGCSSLTSVNLPSAITSIQYATFWDCSSLSSMVIPSAVTSIEGYAFYKCTSLVVVTIPTSVISIGEHAFDGCINWTGPLTIPPSVTSIEKLTFNDCRSLTSLVLPSSVDSIGESAFNGCSGLTGPLNLPSTLTLIGSWAFNNCSALTGALVIPPLVTSIENHSFAGCSGFTSLILPSSLSYIGYGALNGCSSLTSIESHPLVPVPLDTTLAVFDSVDKNTCTLTVPYGTKDLYAEANQWKDFTHLIAGTQGFVLSSGSLNFKAGGGNTDTLSIDANVSWTASADQLWLTVNPSSGNTPQSITVTAEANLSGETRIGTIRFSSTGFLNQTITVSQDSYPKTVMVTPGGLSAALTSEEKSTLTHLKLTGTIDARDFKTMRNEMPVLAVLDLSEVSIAAYDDTISVFHASYPKNSIPGKPYLHMPFSKTSDNDRGYSSALQTLDFGPNYSLSGKASLSSVILPPALISIGNGAFNDCTGLSSMIIPANVDTIGTGAFMGCHELTTCYLPPSITSIGAGAFYGCNKLSSIELPEGITSIENWTFGYCSVLRFIDIPSSVTSIGGSAFYGCSRLQKMVIPQTVTQLADGLFAGCIELATVVIPSSVAVISREAFLDCSGLTSITMPPSINRIEETAFFGCRNLMSIYVNRITPVDLTKATSVFYEVNKNVCKLYVPYGSSALYAAAPEWKDFKTIVEMVELKLSQTTVNMEANQGSTAIVEMTSDVPWSVSCDQTWLTVNPASGTGNQMLTFTADANSTAINRLTTVTVFAPGIDPQTIVVTQLSKPTELSEVTQDEPSLKCYPNPFIHQIVIEIQNPQQEKITVDIYNLPGQRVKNLANGITDEYLKLSWNGTNDKGQSVPPGVYLCKVNRQCKQLIMMGQ